MNNDTMRPPIVISDAERQQLYKLAQSALNRLPHIADELMTELDRAEISPARAMPVNTVRMNSYVRFHTDKGTEHVVQLVYPENADIVHDRLSILSILGTALIGLSEGQTMTWRDRDGRDRTLTVTQVSQIRLE